MRRPGRRELCLGLGALAAGLAGPARAAQEPIKIQGLSITRSLACEGRAVDVYGTDHRLTLRGRCPQVWVHGTGHVVHVEGLGAALLTGLNNRLEWEHALEGERPDVQLTGVGNVAVQAGPVQAGPAAEAPAGVTIGTSGGRVEIGPGGVSVEGGAGKHGDGQVTVASGGAKVRVDGRSGKVQVGAPAADRADLTIEDSDQHRTYDCGGGSAVVDGGDNELTLRNCRELTVAGGDNRIVLVGPVARIVLEGADNQVEWSEGEGGQPPTVEKLGTGNRVTRR